jgi:glycerol kinase
MTKYILAIDQGTTGSTALVLSQEGETLGRSTHEFRQHFPKPGWVEHDTREIWGSVEQSVREAISEAKIAAKEIAAIGITNQRETTVVWNKATGEPISRAIVWQCRRTADVCDKLKAEGHADKVRAKTGLVIDAYFSGTKIAWLLDNVKGARDSADKGELAFGTIDSWLVSKLTKNETHVTDVTNASRTLLCDIQKVAWDAELCKLFRVPENMLPKIVGSAEIVAHTKGVSFLPDGIPISGIAGDQQAALFGQACFEEGDAKCTYGTGAFALMNIGKKSLISTHGLVTTIAWKVGGEVTYALEGSAFIAGAAVQWLRDGLGIIKAAPDIEALARQVESSDGVVFVPALAGLGAPHWDQDARGTITGITRGTTAAHLARATLEGIAFQVADLLIAMKEDAARPLTKLRVDGGAAKNDLLMQFQSDLLDVVVERPRDVESTGRGAAMLAAVGAGLAKPADAAKLIKKDRDFSPHISAEQRSKLLEGWHLAVTKAKAKTAEK